MGLEKGTCQMVTVSIGLPLTVAAMCSSGFETQNLKYRTNDDSRTNVKKRTNTAIAYSRC